MDFPSKELLNYGVAMAVLVPVLGFFLWAGRAIVVSLIEQAKLFIAGLVDQQKAFAQHMKELTATLVGIRENCQACRADAVSSARDTGDRMERVAWAAHDKMVLSFRESLTGAAQSIRESNANLAKEVEVSRLQRENNELSRPHEMSATPRPVR